MTIVPCFPFTSSSFPTSAPLSHSIYPTSLFIWASGILLVPSPSFPPALSPHNPAPFPTPLTSTTPQHHLKFCSSSLENLPLLSIHTPATPLPTPIPPPPLYTYYPKPCQDPNKTPLPSQPPLFPPSRPLSSNLTQPSPTPFLCPQ